jgi:hypothetical protein
MHSLDDMSSGSVMSHPLRVAAAVVLVLNLLDAIFTIGWVQLGAAEEANPLMAGPLANGPLLFMLVKLSLVSLCVALLWRLRVHRSAIAGMYATAGVYTVLLAYHLSAAPHVANYVASN